jgi:Domain of unknown function (DUF4337)
MSVHEEVEEHIHHAHGIFDKLVAASMAVIAAILAVVSLFGQHFNTEKLLTQQKASDMWAYYQAKDIRRYSASVAQDVLGVAKAAPGLIAKYAQDASRYKKQTEDIVTKAQDLEKERDKLGEEADYFHYGEVFLEVAIVLSSLAILMKRRAFFYGGLACALAGVVISASGWILFGLSGKA